MSFICQRCNHPVAHSLPAERQTLLTRLIEHPKRFDDRGNCIDKGGHGMTIVKEQMVGPCCAERAVTK